MKGEKGGGHRIFTQSQKSLQVTAFNAPDQGGEKCGKYAGILNPLFQPQQEDFALALLGVCLLHAHMNFSSQQWYLERSKRSVAAAVMHVGYIGCIQTSHHAVIKPSI